MTYETKQAYTEVYFILQKMPIEYKNKIPKQLIDMFEMEKLKDYEVNIDNGKLIDKSKLKRETLVILAIFNYHYWCPNKQQKDKLFQQYFSNNEKYQKKMAEKYSIDNLFKNKENIMQVNDKEQENVAMVEYKESFLKRLIYKIKNIFRK